jgi:hypothetical protein
MGSQPAGFPRKSWTFILNLLNDLNTGIRKLIDGLYWRIGGVINNDNFNIMIRLL